MRFNFHLTLSNKGLILVGIPLVFELVFVGTLSWLLAQSELERKREADGREVIAHASNTLFLVASNLINLTSHVGYSAAQPKFEEGFNQVLEKVSDEFRSLNTLIKGHPKEEEIINQLRERVAQSLRRYKTVNMMFKDGRMLDAYAGLASMKPMLRDMQLLVDKLSDEVRRITEATKTEAQWRGQIHNLLLFGVILNILIAIGLAIYFNRGTTRRLGVLMDNTDRLVKHQPLNPPVAGGDEIAHLDQVFHNMASELAQAERAKQEYVAMISHDLRSPLTSIQFVLTMVANGTYGSLTEQGLGRVTAAESSAERLISLINTLLDLEKMEAGKLEMQLEEASLSSVIQRAVEAIYSLAEQSGITIETPETQKSETKVNADADRLVQVLVNLLSNAIKFSPKGYSVTVSFREIPDFIEVRVMDRGRGIPASHRDSIFDRFQQVEDSDAREHGGTGLGLAICKAIIEGHGGSIGVESEMGKGSTFWFRVPTL